MWKKILLLLLTPLLLAGCGTFTNLTPQRQTRNANNLYPVEVAFNTRQQTLRWDSIRPFVIVGTESYPMRQTLMMKNRWEGLAPVPAGAKTISYRYKFEFKYNVVGNQPQDDSLISPPYTLQILDR
jgi:uncharacterized protein YceK